MDKHTERISFKAFWDAVEQRLAAYSADELRAILCAMAQETPPSGRQAFLEKLKPSETGMGAPEPAPQEDLLTDIDDWMEELRAEMEDTEAYEDRHGYDWGERSDDEDSLGPYAEFVEPLDEFFDRAEAVFDYGHLTLARDAYEKLFGEALKLEDEYGRGVRAQDLKVGMNQARVPFWIGLRRWRPNKDRARCAPPRSTHCKSFRPGCLSARRLLTIWARRRRR